MQAIFHLYHSPLWGLRPRHKWLAQNGKSADQLHKDPRQKLNDPADHLDAKHPNAARLGSHNLLES